jgi:spoIIIJ-associated protein
MAREIERTAATVDEATSSALDWLGVGADEVEVEIVQEAGSAAGEPAEATVRVRLREDPVASTAGSSSARNDEELADLEEQADAIADFVDELLAKMGIDAIAEPNPQDGHMYVDIVDGPEDDMSLLIGRHGQTLEAIQELARMAVGRRLDQRIRVIVDVEDYRKRRESQLEEDAREAALRVASEGGEYEFDAMNAYERKLVHDAVAGVDGVETMSRGETPDRYVVIRKV